MDKNGRPATRRCGVLRRSLCFFVVQIGLLLLLGSAPAIAATGFRTFLWETNNGLVSADLKTVALPLLLSKVSANTGWKVYLEPGTRRAVSTKFEKLPVGEAMKLLLGDLSYALVPDGRGPMKLLVFRTKQDAATTLVSASARTGNVIPNELVVRLKPGANIHDIARALGAKVTGQIPGLNAYRLEFGDGDAAAAAKESLASNSDVGSVEDNYLIDRPTDARSVGGVGVPPLQLQLNPPPENGRIIIGLIDTAVQPLGNGLDSFLLKSISVAGDGNSDPNTPEHGTVMAEGILRTLQVLGKGSSAVQILPVNVYGAGESTSTFDVAMGITQAVNNGARILNLSLGSENDSPLVRDLILDASKKDIAVFAAKGNTPDTRPFYPAANPGAIAVTAVENGQIAPYANQAEIPAVGAPGSILVPYNGQTYAAQGTSVSTAIVSGTAANFMDKNGKSVPSALSFIKDTLAVRPGATGGK